MQIYSEKNMCCGCTACCEACPVNAVTMKKDRHGFVYPEVDDTICINCGKCKKVCPFKNSPTEEKNIPDVYALKCKDDDIRMQSASGAAFSAIAENIIENGGMVYGVECDENFVVKHSCAETKEDYIKFRGSKYVQSEMGNIFTDVKRTLDDEKYVLFSGTPCQVAGLKLFLGKDYPKLYTVDLVCHGVPTPLMWEEFIAKIKQQYVEKNIKNVICRDTAIWGKYISKIIFSDKTEQYTKEYIDIYSSNYALRESCFNCKFASSDRPGDFTIMDFWGINDIMPDFTDNKGVSVVMLNTEKAKMYIKHIEKNAVLQKTELKNILVYQPRMEKPVKKPRLWQRFWEDYDRYGYDGVFEKYIVKKYGRRFKLFCAKTIITIRKRFLG